MILQMMNENTEKQIVAAVAECRAVFAAKLTDYGAAWRVMRPASVTDQLLIKVKRIRTLEMIGEDSALVNEGIRPELIGIVNYGAVALNQCFHGIADEPDIDVDVALQIFDNVLANAVEVIREKNHDYGEAWRLMRPTSYTDLILTKLNRIRNIEDHHYLVEVSENVESHYYDCINYSLFGLIRMTEREGAQR